MPGGGTPARFPKGGAQWAPSTRGAASPPGEGGSLRGVQRRKNNGHIPGEELWRCRIRVRIETFWPLDLRTAGWGQRHSKERTRFSLGTSARRTPRRLALAEQLQREAALEQGGLHDCQPYLYDLIFGGFGGTSTVYGSPEGLAINRSFCGTFQASMGGCVVLPVVRRGNRLGSAGFSQRRSVEVQMDCN